MVESSDVARLVAKTEKEISYYEERLRDAKIYLKGLLDAVRVSSRAPAPQPAPAAPTGSTAPAEKPPDVPDEETQPIRLRPGTAIAGARDAILAAGQPLYISDILAAMGRSEEDRVSLVGSLSKYVGREEVFIRTAPNTFGLLELGHGPKEE